MTRPKVLLLALVLICVPLAHPAHAQSGSPDATARIKADVAKRIAHKNAHVKIELRNGDKLQGRIEQADDNKFTIRDDKTKNSIDVNYSDVMKLKGQGLGAGKKIGIIVAAAVVVVGIVGYIAVRNAF